MMILNILEQIQADLAAANFERALEALQRLTLDSEELRMDIVLLSARYQQLRKDRLRNTISADDEKRFQNQLTHAILEVIRDIRRHQRQDAGSRQRVAEIAYRIGNHLLQLQQFGIAIDYFDTVIDTEGCSSTLRLQALNDRGAARLALGDTESALSDFNAAIGLQPSESISYYNRGMAYLRLAERDFQFAHRSGLAAAEPYTRIFQ